jgi:glycosyltransferase involved in cell wall biosynthesis
LKQHPRISSEKVEVIYNGIAMGRFGYDPPKVRDQKRREFCIRGSHKVVGTVANLSIQKDHRTFIKAASVVLKKCPETVFFIAGGGQEKFDKNIRYESIGALRKFALECKCQDKVIFAGERPDVPEILSMFDVCVSSSIQEGFSNAVLEASAAGVPVVATSVSGNREAVVEGETGFLVPERNPNQMAARIVFLLKNRKEAVRMGSQGRLRISKLFTAEIMVGKTERLYESLMRKMDLI